MVNFSVGAEKIQNDNTILIWHYQKVRMFEGKEEKMKEGRKAKKKKKKRNGTVLKRTQGNLKEILVANTEKNPSKKISNNTGL